jgi:hypothetical protein
MQFGFNATGKYMPLLNLRRFSSHFKAISNRQHGGRLRGVENLKLRVRSCAQRW